MYKNLNEILFDFQDTRKRDFLRHYLSLLDKNLITKSDAEISKKHENFLTKYFLNSDEFLLQTSHVSKHFIRETKDNNSYSLKIEGFKYLFRTEGGEIWNSHNFQIWKELFLLLSEDNFFIMEDDYTMGGYPCGFNFKFPTKINWNNFFEGAYITAAFFFENFYSFFILGANNNWMRYIETDGHREMDTDGNISIVCYDYFGLNNINDQLKNVLKKLGYEQII